MDKKSEREMESNDQDPMDGLAGAPEEQEELTPSTSETLARVRASLAEGKGIPHEEVLREFGLQP